MKSGLLLTSAFALALTGCMVGPDFIRPKAPDAKTYTEGAMPEATSSADATGGAPQRFAQATELPERWWTLFGSADLNHLVDEAVAGNPDLDAARASLRQAKENVYAVEGNLFPSVDLTPSVTREKFNPSAFGQTGVPGSVFTLYNASVSVSYGLDLFGGTRRAVEVAKAQEQYQKEEMEAAYITLTGNVVTAAIFEASLREQVAATQEVVNLLTEQLKTLRTQFELGAIPKSSVLQQETLLDQTLATLPPLEKQLAQKRHQLSALIGHLPGDPLPETFSLSGFTLPTELPVSLPSKLVEQRPDIRAAEANLHAASAEIGVATANLFPQIALTGSYGVESNGFGHLFTMDNVVWAAAAGVTQPIFHGGTLFAEKREAAAAYDKSLAQYRSTLIAAFQNVADTLRALQFDADALKTQAEADRVARESLKLARVQYSAGSISYPQLLDSERAWQQSRIQLVQAEAARYSDTAALFTALGGGWWQRADIEHPAKTSEATDRKKP